MKINHPYIKYIAKFIGAFCVLFFGTQVIIGLAAPGGYYSGFIHKFVDYPTALRNTLLFGAKILVSFFGYESYAYGDYYLRITGGRGVKLVYSCLGIGLMSFWTAFVYANTGSFKKKLAWIAGGLSAIWLINITRIALLLLAVNKNQPLPFNLDHHTLFNIAAYTAIFIMIYFFDRSQKNEPPSSIQQKK